MRTTLVTTVAMLTTATLLTISASNAATYNFNFLSSDAELRATGEVTVNTVNEVTKVSGAVAGLTNQTITGVTADPSFPSASYSPDGSFIFDNLYSPTGMAFDFSGLLFTTAENPGGYWNLWASSPGASRRFRPIVKWSPCAPRGAVRRQRRRYSAAPGGRWPTSPAAWLGGLRPTTR